MKKMNTINTTAKLCKERDIGISRNHIRSLANSGEVAALKIGNKTLINWESLMNYLDTCTLKNDESKKGIRKITA